MFINNKDIVPPTKMYLISQVKIFCYIYTFIKEVVIWTAVAKSRLARQNVVNVDTNKTLR